MIDFLEKNIKVNITTEEYMKCYNAVHQATRDKKKDQLKELFDWYSDIMMDYVKSYCFKNLEGKYSEEYLNILIKEWENFKIFLHWFSLIMKLFDR